MIHGNGKGAPTPAGHADAALDALDALAEALLPRLARLARAEASKDGDRAALIEMLGLAGYEIDEENGEPSIPCAAKSLRKAHCAPPPGESHPAAAKKAGAP